MKLDERIMTFIPLLAPVPTAWMIYEATSTLMGYPEPVAAASALTVEGIGFVSINLANEMREFNRHLNGVELKQKMQAPTSQAYGVAGLYVATATLMTVALHIVPVLTVYAPLPFILMAVAGGWLWALRREHTDRVAKWNEGRAKATLKRRSAKSSDAGSDAQRRSATLNLAGSVAQRRSATKSARPANAPAKIYRCVCGYETENRYEYSGHTRTCETHKAAKVKSKREKLIPVELPAKDEVRP